MTAEQKPHTGQANGDLWGRRARDWADVQEGTCREVYEQVLSRLGVGARTRFLDVGCGAGMAAQVAAALGASVSGLDASANLIAIARERVPGGAFTVGELERLELPDASFDLVTGFNSFQYAGNPRQALGEARRVLNPEGRVVIMTWGTPEGMEAATLVGALKPVLPPAPPGAPGPFALSAEAALREFAEGAGLKPLEVFDVSTAWRYPDLATGLRGLKSSGVAARAIAHSGEDAVDHAHGQALSGFRRPDGSYVIGARYRCLVAAPSMTRGS